jgi:lipopolysaccharide transport system permease protein
MKSDDIMVTSRNVMDASHEPPESEAWTMVLSPDYPWYHLNLSELWRYRDLVKLFVRRDFVAQYKQTILGPLWFFLQPLFASVVFTVVFGRIAKIPTDGIPDFLFYLSGTVCWGYFSACLTLNSETFIVNAAIFGKVYFPRMVVPLSVTISNIFKFLIQFVLFGGFMIYYAHLGAPIRLTWGMLLLPFLVLQMGVLGLGTGILVSSLTTKYRDLRFVVAFGANLWMYATPIVYPLSQVPERFRIYFAFNPMSAVIECFRWAFFGTPFPEALFIFLSLTSTLLVLVVGLVFFNRIEKTFMDTV